MVTENSYLKEIARDTRHIHDIIEGKHPHKIIVYPKDGGVALIPAGRTIFDLILGRVITSDEVVTDMSHKLSDIGAPYISGVHLHPFGIQSMSIELDHGDGSTSLPFWLDVQHHVITHADFRRMFMYTSFAGAIFAEFGTSPEAPPVIPSAVESPSSHFGELTTTDNWESIVLRPSIFNPRTGIVSTMSEAKAKLNAVLGGTVIDIIYANKKTVQVYNTGDNSVDVRIQGALSGDPTKFITDTTISALAAGASQTVNITPQYIFLRAQARSAGAGSPSTVEVYVLCVAGL